jgi:hypothetical protein
LYSAVILQRTKYRGTFIDLSVFFQNGNTSNFGKSIELGNAHTEMSRTENILVRAPKKHLHSTFGHGDSGDGGRCVNGSSNDLGRRHGDETDKGSGQAKDLNRWTRDGDTVEVVEKVEEDVVGEVVCFKDGRVGSKEGGA